MVVLSHGLDCNQRSHPVDLKEPFDGMPVPEHARQGGHEQTPAQQGTHSSYTDFLIQDSFTFFHDYFLPSCESASPALTMIMFGSPNGDSCS